jgi:hypothetical protein
MTRAGGLTQRIVDPQEPGPAVRPTTLEALIQRIDRRRLGLDNHSPLSPGASAVGTFRGVAQGATESDLRYWTRLTFLAKWSEFLQQEGIRADAQSAIQEAFERAQTTFNSAVDDFGAILVRAVLIDPDTHVAGTPEAIEMYKKFLLKKEFEHRTQYAEAVLMWQVAEVLGDERAERFKKSVWPGIDDFGYIEPMVPHQVLAPSDSKPASPKINGQQ